MTHLISQKTELLQKKIFPSQEAAVREMIKNYNLQQVNELQKEISRFEKKYGMALERFRDYLQARSLLLEQDDLTASQRQIVSRAIMQEEDDCLDWQVAHDFLEGWLGLRQDLSQ